MPRPQGVLDREHTGLLVIDLQEGYRGKLHQEERTLRATTRLLEAAGVLHIPVVVTEQYPKGLGATRAEVAAHFPEATARFEKTSFSAWGAEGLGQHIEVLGRRQWVVVGIETHVCVNQTAHDLLARDLEVHLVRDAVTARFPLEDDTGWSKIIGAGAIPTSTECVLFEWLEDARAPEFKAIHKLVV